jgi:peroxiredoxin
MEMPSLASLQEEYRAKGLRIVAVTEEDLSTVSMFVERNPFPFTVLVDSKGKLSERLGVWALPLTLILDKNRKLVYFHQGARLWDTPDIEEELNRLVSE